jgi:hypothetical protein
LAEVYYPPVASVVLGFRRADVAHPLDGFGMLIPEKEGFNILGALFSSSLFPNRAPEGEVDHHLLHRRRARSAACPETAECWSEMAVKDLEPFWAFAASRPFSTSPFIARPFRNTTWALENIRALMNDMELKAPGLFVAGHARDGISLGDSIVSGHNVAGRIKHFWLHDRAFFNLAHPVDRMNTRAVLLVNLGSPDSTSVADVRTYLREFLMDGRVLDAPIPSAGASFISPFCPSARPNRPKPTKKSGRRRLAPGGHQPQGAAALQARTPASGWNWPCVIAIRPSRSHPQVARRRHPKRCCSSRFFRTTPCPATKRPSSGSRKSSRPSRRTCR